MREIPWRPASELLQSRWSVPSLFPLCHKIALKDMQEDEDVYKYGQVIGRTTQVIKKGALVWHENLMGFARDYETVLL